MLAKPVLEANELARGGGALAEARATVAALGLDPGVRVRLTGTLALDAEELVTVATGAEWGLIASLIMVAGLLALARARARRRVVVKRPLHAPTLAPDTSLVFKGRAVRFDVYLIAGESVA